MFLLFDPLELFKIEPAVHAVSFSALDPESML
jgi:hypothetical protein